MLGRRDGQVSFELGDQTRVTGKAEDVVDPVGFAPSHQLVPGKTRVRAQHDLDPRPSLTNSCDDAGHLGPGAGRGIDVRGPQ